MSDITLIVMICDYFNCSLSLAEALLESARADGSEEELISTLESK